MTPTQRNSTIPALRLLNEAKRELDAERKAKQDQVEDEALDFTPSVKQFQVYELALQKLIGYGTGSPEEKILIAGEIGRLYPQTNSIFDP
jgi:hypothetical protein